MNETNGQRTGRTSAAGLAAGTIGIITVIIYGALIGSQNGTENWSRILFVAGFILLSTLTSIAGAILAKRNPEIGSSLLLASALGNLGLGILAMFSIGILLVAATLMNLVGFILESPKSITKSAACSIVIMAFLCVGILATG